MKYSPAGIVKRTPPIIGFDIGITVSIIHQISDCIKMSLPGVQKADITYIQSQRYYTGWPLHLENLCFHVNRHSILNMSYKRVYSYGKNMGVLKNDQNQIIGKSLNCKSSFSFSCCHYFWPVSVSTMNLNNRIELRNETCELIMM